MWIYKWFKSGILAGICIGLGGTAFLKVGGIVGAVLFTFGLLTVVHYRLGLYTGTAGFINVKDYREWIGMVIIIIGNILGCGLVAGIASIALPDVYPVAESILQKRIENGWLNDGLLAICCGFIMTTAVEFGRNDKFLPLLFGVPLFIMCGFTHSIADAFYLLCNPFSNTLNNEVGQIYLSEIVGNFIGCNVYRILK